MDPWERLDLYCERTDAGFWSEPVNALTNAAFLVAAALLWRGAAGAGERLLLAALVGLIGIGSFLFHTFATAWASWLDRGPIALYIYVFLWLFLGRVAGLPWWGALGGLGLFAVASRVLTARFPPGSFNGSYVYFPALAALALLAACAWGRRRGSAGRLAAAAGLFGLSIVFRSVDETVCASWPLGTHFLWHGLNAVVLYLTATALGPPARAAA